MKKLLVTVNGVSYEVEVELIEEDNTVVGENIINANRPVFKPSEAPTNLASKPSHHTSSDTGDGIMKSPMNGKILNIKVNIGESVKKGQVVIELEAMKMKTNIYANVDGKIKGIFINHGDLVESGQKLLEYE